MAVYLINMLLILFWGSILGKRKKKLYIIIVSVQFILIAGLRSMSVGADTQSYWFEMQEARTMAFGELFGWLEGFATGTDSAHRNAMFLIVLKIWGMLTGYSYRFFLFAVITVFMAGLGRFLYQYSSNICMAYMLFAAFYFDFCLTATRQMLAVAIVCFWGTDAMLQRNIKKYLLVLLLGVLCHPSCIVCVPFYFICGRKRTRMLDLTYLAACFLVLVFGEAVVEAITNNSLYRFYSGGTGGEARGLILMTLAVVVAGILAESRAEASIPGSVYAFGLKGAEMSLLFMIAALYNSIWMRASYYFLPYIFVYLPELAGKVKKEQRALLVALLYMALLFLFWMRPERHAYSFFWN